MIGRLASALLLVATSGFAANLPRFAFTFTNASLSGTAVTVDSSGNTYLTGTVVGNPFTASPGAFQPQNAGGTCSSGTAPPLPVPCSNAFVIKLDPTGAVVFATYLGGGGNAGSSAIAVDSAGNVYVAGNFGEGDFPVTPGAAFPNASASSTNSFITKLNASGTQLAYSTFIPGAVVSSIALDSAGNVYFTGGWSVGYNVPFPATPGAYQSAPADSAGATIVGKLNASGSALVFGTYLSGALGLSGGVGIAVDAAGNVIVAGTNYAADFPATSGQFSTVAGDANVYLAKFNADGSDLIYATLLGPAEAIAMKATAGGDIYIECDAAGPGFPVTGGGFNVAPPARNGSFLMQVGADGSSVVSSISLPFGLSQAGGLDVDSAGNAYLLGYTNDAPPLQTSTGAFQPTLGDETPGVLVAKITPDGQVAGATYLGASAANSVTAIAAERDGSVVVAGVMSSIDFAGLATASPAAGVNTFLAANFFPAITLQNSASYVANTVAPGELVSIRGYGIGPAAGLNSAPAAELGGVQVYFDNFVAPMIYAQAEQINVQAPWEIAGQTTTQVRIVYNGAALPGVFYIENSDGSFNSPSNPAQAGGYVSVYGTGGGVMSPPGVTGASWPLAPLSRLMQPVSVTVGDEGILYTLYSGSAPTLESGFFQINVRLPTDLTPGAQFLSLDIGGVTSAPAAISIQ